MNEQEFNTLADQMLDRIEQALEACDGSFDYETKPGGVLELDFENGSKVILNRHGAAREIWIAAKSGGFHFRPEGGKWLDTRDGSELLASLSRCISAQSGEDIHLT